jgi:hypothetical protein
MNGKVIASQFRIAKLLGQGGMGSVYLAEQMPGRVEEAIPFFRQQLAGTSGVTTTETEVNGAPYFVVSAEGHTLPFRTLAVMKTPDALRPASGDWVQISISK